MNNDMSSALAVLTLAFVLSLLVGIKSQLRESEAKLNALLMHMGIAWGQYAEPSEEVIALAKDPKAKIEAIKAYRTQTGLGLKEAKEVIDKLASTTAESH
ncbi:ribosomal protein L7/L12 [Paucibacter sp. B2R-40]|uniref:ribosomal protein L7/L12 n=1 Tax=Paucibacter sp. B2R-40 TaxID=2893554 RepID=UPI0021E358EB|nr:ribosomal protein L7/L12 [Paucibacter sp. B2R-40]MCV2354613.1 ribosomal protein L7/L12 [Paucibacter sp. B2R-40]